MPVVCVGAPGRTESLSDSEVSFDFLGTCRSYSEFSVVVVGKGTSLDVVLLKGGCKLAEAAERWSLGSIPTTKYAR